MGSPPLRDDREPSSADESHPHSEPSVRMLRLWVTLTRRQHEHLPTCPLSIILRAVEILCRGIVSARNSYTVTGIFSSQSPWCLHIPPMGLTPTRSRQTLAYGFPSSDPWAGESLAVFLCQCHSIDEIAPLGVQGLPLC